MRQEKRDWEALKTQAITALESGRELLLSFDLGAIFDQLSRMESSRLDREQEVYLTLTRAREHLQVIAGMVAHLSSSMESRKQSTKAFIKEIRELVNTECQKIKETLKPLPQDMMSLQKRLLTRRLSLISSLDRRDALSSQLQLRRMQLKAARDVTFKISSNIASKEEAITRLTSEKGSLSSRNLGLPPLTQSELDELQAKLSSKRQEARKLNSLILEIKASSGVSEINGKH